MDWIEFVKKYAKDKKITYKEALKKASEPYKKTKAKGENSKKAKPSAKAKTGAKSKAKFQGGGWSEYNNYINWLNNLSISEESKNAIYKSGFDPRKKDTWDYAEDALEDSGADAQIMKDFFQLKRDERQKYH